MNIKTQKKKKDKYELIRYRLIRRLSVENGFVGRLNLGHNKYFRSFLFEIIVQHS